MNRSVRMFVLTISLLAGWPSHASACFFIPLFDPLNWSCGFGNHNPLATRQIIDDWLGYGYLRGNAGGSLGHYPLRPWHCYAPLYPHLARPAAPSALPAPLTFPMPSPLPAPWPTIPQGTMPCAPLPDDCGCTDPCQSQITPGFTQGCCEPDPCLCQPVPVPMPVPVTTWRPMTVDYGSYQSVWVPRPVTQYVPQTTWQMRPVYPATPPMYSAPQMYPAPQMPPQQPCADCQAGRNPLATSHWLAASGYPHHAVASGGPVYAAYPGGNGVQYQTGYRPVAPVQAAWTPGVRWTPQPQGNMWAAQAYHPMAAGDLRYATVGMPQHWPGTAGGAVTTRQFLPQLSGDILGDHEQYPVSTDPAPLTRATPVIPNSYSGVVPMVRTASLSFGRTSAARRYSAVVR